MARKPRNKREQTRLTLIEATIQSIVEIGLPDTTVTSIMQRAGLSRGMLHLHFGSKDELLEATAAFFAEDYYVKQEAFLKNVGKDPISRLKAMIDADFSEELLNQTTAIVWYVDVDDEQAKQIMLVDNKLNDDATYDFEKLERAVASVYLFRFSDIL